MKTNNVIGARTSCPRVPDQAEAPHDSSVSTNARATVLPVCNRRIWSRPDCQLQTGGTLMAPCLAAILILFSIASGQAAPFNSGSTGAFGPMNITSNTTLTMPADGIFHCTTINVAPSVTLRFAKNALNTPVYLLATSNVTISGIIDVSGGNNAGVVAGVGSPGGFDGGYGGFGSGVNNLGGDGQGPGGGRNLSGQWYAAFATVGGSSPGNTNKYGNALLSPLIGGSGGSGGSGNPGGGGGGGGGAILIAANTSITLNGIIRARGGSGYVNGSGGSIRLVSPLVTGLGSLDVIGGGGSSDGRVRIDCEDRYAFRSLSTPATTTRGAQMFVFPAVVPRLDIIEAAGQPIPAGTGNSVQIELPAGAATNRTVRVQGRDFTGVVPITVAVIPENRPSVRYDSQINMASGNPAEVTVNVVIPDGTSSRIQTWTR